MIKRKLFKKKSTNLKKNLFIEVQKKKYPASIILKPLNSKNIRFT